MADITILDVSAGTASDVETTSGISALAEAQTVPCENGKDHRIGLIVRNADAQTATITIAAPASDGGVRKGLGDYTLTALAGKTYLVNLSDTSRFKDLSDNDIDVTATTTGTIGSVEIFAVQL